MGERDTACLTDPRGAQRVSCGRCGLPWPVQSELQRCQSGSREGARSELPELLTQNGLWCFNFPPLFFLNSQFLLHCCLSQRTLAPEACLLYVPLVPSLTITLPRGASSASVKLSPRIPAFSPHRCGAPATPSPPSLLPPLTSLWHRPGSPVGRAGQEARGTGHAESRGRDTQRAGKRSGAREEMSCSEAERRHSPRPLSQLPCAAKPRKPFEWYLRKAAPLWHFSSLDYKRTARLVAAERGHGTRSGKLQPTEPVPLPSLHVC
nr:uncharacterized protein LOC112990669 [Dromaius novaehollandiae]